MGIDGLLTLLKPITKKQHISSFREKTIGIDTLPWIYKGMYGASLQMGEDQQQHGFLYYILEMIDMLEFYKIKPIFIFDGKAVQAKSKTLSKRKKVKDENEKKAKEMKEKQQPQESKKFKARCMTIDEKAISLVMNLLISKKIEFIVAPYEADCQIAKMFNEKLIEAVITEDSDLLVYGVDVILKLKQTGECDYLSLNPQKNEESVIESTDCAFLKIFWKFSQQQKTEAAILAGCDYVESVKGIGLKKAIKLVQNNENLEKIVDSLNKDEKLSVPQNYLELVTRAKLIFFFATVFDPHSKSLNYLRRDMLDQLSPKDMEEKQLQAIIGEHYEFTEDHFRGKTNCKTQEKRDLQGLDLKKIYHLNRQNITFDSQEVKKEKTPEIQWLKVSGKKAVVEQTSSVCWEGPDSNQEDDLAFLLQKELVNSICIYSVIANGAEAVIDATSQEVKAAEVKAEVQNLGQVGKDESKRKGCSDK